MNVQKISSKFKCYVFLTITINILFLDSEKASLEDQQFVVSEKEAESMNGSYMETVESDEIYIERESIDQKDDDIKEEDEIEIHRDSDNETKYVDYFFIHLFLTSNHYYNNTGTEVWIWH